MYSKVNYLNILTVPLKVNENEIIHDYYEEFRHATTDQSMWL